MCVSPFIKRAQLFGGKMFSSDCPPLEQESADALPAAFKLHHSLPLSLRLSLPVSFTPCSLPFSGFD